MTSVVVVVGRALLWSLHAFVALFPFVVAVLAVDSARRFALDRRGISTARIEPTLADLDAAQARWPVVAVVVPAHDEELHVARTVRAALDLRWPQVRVVVVDDGSSDGTAAAVEAVADPRVEVVRLERNGGKAAALNLALAMVDTELVLQLDADARPERDVLEWLVPQLLRHDDVAAVTANPRVLNTSSLVGALQACEISGTVSALRRGQAAWGRVCTMSGICTLLRREAVLAAGGFDTRMHTEDIELSWRLQTTGWRLTYEPEALVGMQVPTTYRSWWHQRTRWATGLVEALRTHRRALVAKENRTLWPLALESLLSILWCHALVLVTALYLALLPLALQSDVAENPLPGRWGALVLSVGIFQVLWGMHLDARHDAGITRLWWVAPLYPLLYWWMSAATVVRTTVPTLLRPLRPVVWSSNRTVA
ncbi:MAG: glycosyltransferase family 2 protein [Actinomycetes bacterium]